MNNLLRIVMVTALAVVCGIARADFRPDAPDEPGTTSYRVGVVAADCQDTTFFDIDDGSEMQLTASPQTGKLFVGWSDGVTDNPRVVTITQDSVFVARFASSTYQITIVDTICKGESFVVGDTAYTKSGHYLDTLQTSWGTDSIIDLTLYVAPTYSISLYDSIAAGDSFYCEYNGKTYTKAGKMYTEYLTSELGCDSIVYHYLRIMENAPRHFYVMQEKHGKGDGTSWANATNDLGLALYKASLANGQKNEVWVAGGTYRVINPKYKMLLRNATQLYGGFAGTETSIEERQKVADGQPWEYVNRTIITGYDSTYCFSYYNTTTGKDTSVIDGITFEHGYYHAKTLAAGVSLRGNTTLRNCVVRNCVRDTLSAGGVYAATSGITIEGCLIENNSVTGPKGGGAGIYAVGAIKVRNSVVRNNTLSVAGTGYGAGIYAKTGMAISNSTVSGNTMSAATGYAAGMEVIGALTMNNVKVTNNTLTASSKGYGAGLYLQTGSNAASITNSEISFNTGAHYGGAIYLRNATSASLSLDRCEMVGNSAITSGGTLYTYYAYAQVAMTNCLLANNGLAGYNVYAGLTNFTHNTVANNKGYVYLRAADASTLIANNILWNAVTYKTGTISAASSIGAADVKNNACSYSLSTTRSWVLTDNIVNLNKLNTNVAGPNFVSPTTFEGAPATDEQKQELQAADFSLKATSRCINVGVDLASVTNDIRGVARPQHDLYDMGAYEYDGELALTLTLTVNNTKYGTALTDDGLKTKTYVMGDTAYFSATPKTGYKFSHWSDGSTEAERSEVMTTNLSLKAGFVKIPSYTITFLNANGDTLQSSAVKEGVLPVYTGATPTKDETAQYTYSFNQWTPEIVEASEDATYTTTFTETLRQYTIGIKASDCSDTTYYTHNYGEVLIVDAIAADGFAFVRWQDDNTDNPRTFVFDHDGIYTAYFEATTPHYTIRFVNEDGTLLQQLSVEEGTLPEYTEADPVKAATDKYKYDYYDWEPVVDYATADATYTAKFYPSLKLYSVSVQATECPEYRTYKYAYGEKAYFKAQPTLGWKFTQWSDGSTVNPRMEIVTADTTFAAQFEDTRVGEPVEITDWKIDTVSISLVGVAVDEIADATIYINDSKTASPVRDNNDNTISFPYSAQSCDPILIEVLNNKTNTILSRQVYIVPTVIESDSVVSGLSADCDLWVTGGAKATIASREIVNNVVVTPAATLAVEPNATLIVDTVVIKGFRHESGRLDVRGSVQVLSNVLMYAKTIKDKSHYYLTSLPYEVKREQIVMSSGAVPTAKQLQLKLYDGQARADGNGDVWNTTDELPANKGFEFGTNSGNYREFLFPMAVSELRYQSGYSVDLNFYTGKATSPSHYGWNVIGLSTLNEKPKGVAISQGMVDDAIVLMWDGETYDASLSSEVAIAPFRAFMIQATSAAPAVVGNTTVAAPIRSLSDVESIIRLRFSDNQLIDQTTIRLSSQYTNSYDLGYDSEKYMSTKKPQLYSFMAGSKMAFNALPIMALEQPIPLGTFMPNAGSYTFSLDPSRDHSAFESIVLYDAEENVSTDLLVTDYSVMLNSGSIDNRFSLRARMAVETPTALGTIESGIKISRVGDDLLISGLSSGDAAYIYDAAGRLAKICEADGATLRIDMPAAGVYMVRILGSDVDESVKVVTNK